MKAITKSTILTEFPFFQASTDAEKDLLESKIEIRVKRKFSYIYMPEDHSNEVYFLVKGAIKIGTHSSDGREVIKAVIHPHAMFGELGLVGEKHRQDFARSMNEEVTIMVLKVQDFQHLMESNHVLCLKVISLLGKRLRRAENRLESLIFKDARSRIVDFIKTTAENRGRRVGYEMLIKHSLTQQDIANLTGTSRQTVTSVLNDLRKSDLIYFNRRSILIRDMAKLA